MFRKIDTFKLIVERNSRKTRELKRSVDGQTGAGLKEIAFG